MLKTRMRLIAALGVMLGATPVAAAGELSAQATPLPGSGGPVPAVETFYTQLRLDGDHQAMRADGVGVRLMWRPAVADGALRTLADRSELGFFATYTPDRAFDPGVSFSTASLGVAMDVRPFEHPLGGRVEPFVSLGTGVLYTDVSRAVHPSPSPLLERSRTALTVTPGLGARLYLTPDLAIQGDLRDMVTFTGDTRHNVAFGAGLRFGI
ncbi:MAG TPA: hypothetical protein VGE02_11945 [Gemmatimonadales bacterium]